MSDAPSVLVLSGSLRTGSVNTRLAGEAAALARAAGASVTELTLRELDLPLYDPDLEAGAGLPTGALRLKGLLASHGGLVVASPEHNSAYPAALKNAIDWASRAAPGEGPLASFDGRVAGLLSASPGALGGMRGLVALRMLLGNIRVLVVPEQFALGKAHQAFDDEGRLKEEGDRAKVAAVVNRVVELVRSGRSGR